jgi:hypothetical protein
MSAWVQIELRSLGRPARSQRYVDCIIPALSVPVGKVIVSAILSKKVYMYMCPITNGVRDTAISL